MFLGIVFYPVLRFLYKKHNTDRRSLCKTGKADVTLPAGSGVSTTLKRLSGSMTVDLDGVSVKAANVSLASQSSYSIKLTGSGTQTVSVTLNGRKYRDYKVNFNKEKTSVTKDYDISWLSETESKSEDDGGNQD